MVRAQPGAVSGQSTSAHLVASRALNAHGSKIPQDLQKPQTPSRVSGPSQATNESAPYRMMFKQPELPESYTNPTAVEEDPEFPGFINEQSPNVLLNQAVGRDRMRQAAQTQDFPTQPFLKNVARKSCRPGDPLPPPPGTPPPNSLTRPAGFQGGQNSSKQPLALLGSPAAPAKPPPELPDESVAGPPSPFGIVLAQNLPDEVLDNRPVGQAELDVDPFDALVESLVKVHKEQIRIIIAENEELKEKLNTVLISQWSMEQGGDEVTGKVKGSDIMPLHLTTQVPGYLQNSWLWTVTEEEQAKDMVKKNVNFKLLPGWFAPEDFTDQAKMVILGETENTLLPSHTLTSEGHGGHQRSFCRELMCAPDSNTRLFWDICGMFLLLYDLIAIPIGAFKPPDTIFTTLMDWVTLIFWTSDMVASFFTGYVHNGETIMDPGKVAAHYMTRWFWLDLFVVLPDWAFTVLSMTVEGGADAAGGGSLAGLLRVFRAVRVVRLLRLAKLKRLLQMLKDKITSEAVFLAFFIVQLLTALLFANHLLGSLFYLIGDAGTSDHNWIKEMDIKERTLFYRYAASYLWSLSNFGLGSVRVFAENSGETTFAIIVLVSGMLMFSLMTASITSSMVRMQNMSSEQTTQFWLLRRYLRQHKVSQTLTFRLLRFLEFKAASTKELISEDRLSMLDMLSESLRRELKCSVSFGPLLQGHPLFIRGMELSEVVVHSLSDEVLGVKHLAEGDILFTPGSVASCMYYCCSGMQFYQRKTDKDIKVRRGDWLCEAALWVWWACRGSVVASNDCDLITINSQLFGEVVQANETMGALMSGYGEVFCDWLNEVPFEDLTDFSCYDKGGRLADKFVDQVCDNIVRRDREWELEREEAERKAEREKMKRQKRIEQEAARVIQ